MCLQGEGGQCRHSTPQHCTLHCCVSLIPLQSADASKLHMPIAVSCKSNVPQLFHTPHCTTQAMICRGLTTGAFAAHAVSWRLLLLPAWVAWFATLMLLLLKPLRERTFGGLRDLMLIFALFVTLKMDNAASYSWGVVFLIPWMCFGALLLGAILVCACLVWAGIADAAVPGAADCEHSYYYLWGRARTCNLIMLPLLLLLPPGGKCDAVCICTHGPARIQATMWFSDAAAVCCGAAAIVYIPVQLPGGCRGHHTPGAPRKSRQHTSNKHAASLQCNFLAFRSPLPAPPVFQSLAHSLAHLHNLAASPPTSLLFASRPHTASTGASNCELGRYVGVWPADLHGAGTQGGASSAACQGRRCVDST